MKRIILFIRIYALAVFVLILSSNLFPQIVINEILYDPNGSDNGQEWIELYNPTDSAIDMNAWDLDCDLAPYFHFKSFILHAHSYVVIHLRAEGTNTETDLYTGASWSGKNMGNSSGEVTLYDDTTSHATAHLIDFVEWGATGRTHESKAISANQWPDPPDFAPAVSAGHSIAYDGAGNSGTDWRDEETPTPGSDNSLPVFLSSFSATPQKASILIQWTTQSEVNTLGFRVLRSLNRKKDFVPVSELIRGNGNSVIRHRYQFVDHNVQPNVTYYYRLKDIDFNGNSEVHVIVSACIAGQQEEPGMMPDQFQLSEGYPNPFGPGVGKTEVGFNMWIPENSAGKMTIGIWNLLGEEVRQFEWNPSHAGAHVFFWDGTGENHLPVPAGVYFLRVRQENHQKIRKILFIR